MAFREQLIGVDQPDAWRAALDGIRHGYWHTWEACNSAALASGLPTFLYACEDDAGGARAVCPFSERRWRDATDIFTPVGFSGFAASYKSPQLRSHWRAFAAQREYVCAYFALHPVLACHALHENLSADNELFVIDLAISEATLLAQVDRSVRRAVRDADASGMDFVTNRENLTRFILENYRPFMTAMNANPSASWSNDGLRIMCSDPAVFMVGAADNGGVCAVYTFATTRWGAECHLNIFVREGRRFTTQLIWWGARELMAQGIPWLHFGGGVLRNDAIARAKQKFKPKVLPLLGAREVYLPDLYRACCEQADVDPYGDSDFFPKYHARRRR